MATQVYLHIGYTVVLVGLGMYMGPKLMAWVRKLVN